MKSKWYCLLWPLRTLTPKLKPQLVLIIVPNFVNYLFCTFCILYSFVNYLFCSSFLTFYSSFLTFSLFMLFLICFMHNTVNHLSSLFLFIYLILFLKERKSNWWNKWYVMVAFALAIVLLLIYVRVRAGIQATCFSTLRARF